MWFVNAILDLAGLLLWLSWRSVRLDPLARAMPATLVGTVRRAEAQKLKRWHLIAILPVLLFARALLYRATGDATDWTPKLDLGLVVLAFRIRDLSAVTLFSVLSFLRVLAIFYCWLLVLAAILGRSANPDPIQRLLFVHLGWIGRLPRVVIAVLPGFATALAWWAFHPFLAWAGVVNPAHSTFNLVGQGLLLGVAIYFTLKDLLPLILLIYFVATYVYLGKNPLWDFIGAVGRKLLLPLRRFPLQMGKMDFAPLIAIILLLLALYVVPHYALRYRQLWPE